MLNINDESQVSMQIMLSVDVVFPRNVFDLELGFADSADETLAFDFFVNVFLSLSFVGEWINNDTEEDIHQNDIDDHEEREIKSISKIIKLVRLESLPKCISNTTTTSHSKTGCRHQAINEGRAIHIVGSTWRNWSVILIVIGACVGVLFVVSSNIGECEEGV